MLGKKLLIVGAGGHGRAIAEAVLACKELELVGFVDDAGESMPPIWNWTVLGSTAALASCRAYAENAFVAIGNNRLREALHARARAAEFYLPTVVHPRAVVSPTATISHGCAIMAGAVVGTEARLGDGVIVNCGAVVDHHARWRTSHTLVRAHAWPVDPFWGGAHGCRLARLWGIASTSRPARCSNRARG